MVPLTTAWKDAQDRRNRTIPFNLIINDNTSIMILFNLNFNKKLCTCTVLGISLMVLYYRNIL